MMLKPKEIDVVTAENRVREYIDDLLMASGWLIFDMEEANITAGRGVASR